ncbi:TLC domain-containing protein 2-like [Oratosquilla oratoria]|uniref:TLC domain-containing protein 2-like n=1 Tax=Oratosquilla oratoria TaxID=337810 RepID=UPI003F761DFD
MPFVSVQDVEGPVWVLLSLLIFYGTNQLLSLFIPKSARNTRKQAWKWTNTANSLIHSAITGIWSILCFYENPRMAEDLINTYTISSHILVSFSVGYFIHDLIDLTQNHWKRSTFELMGHHCCVILCFGLAVWTKQFTGYAVMALFVEVNSVFLHIRQIMIVTGVPKDNEYYRLTSLFNIGTFIVFRIVVLGWMTRWLVLYRDEIPLPAYTLGSVGLAIMVVMNIVLFARVCIADFMSKKMECTKIKDCCQKKLFEEEEIVGGLLLTAKAMIEPNREEMSEEAHIHLRS